MTNIAKYIQAVTDNIKKFRIHIDKVPSVGSTDKLFLLELTRIHTTMLVQLELLNSINTFLKDSNKRQ